MTGGALELHQMTLYFKLDHKFRIWLLFCTSIKIKDLLLKDDRDSFHKKGKHPMGTNHLHRSVEIYGIENTEKDNMKLIQAEVHIDRSADTVFALNPKQKVCALCFGNFAVILEFSFSFAVAKLHHLVSFFQHDPKHPGLLSALNVLFIREHYRSEARLQKLVKDPLWLNLEFQCCDECYTILTEEYLSLDPMRITLPVRRVLENKIQDKRRPEDSMLEETTYRDRLDTLKTDATSRDAKPRTRLGSVEDGYSIVSGPTNNMQVTHHASPEQLRRSMTPKTAELPHKLSKKFAKFHTQVYQNQPTIAQTDPDPPEAKWNTASHKKVTILPKPQTSAKKSGSPPLLRALEARKRLVDSTQQLAQVPGEYFVRTRASSNGLLKPGLRRVSQNVLSESARADKLKPTEETNLTDTLGSGRKYSQPGFAVLPDSGRKTSSKGAFRLSSTSASKTSPRNFKWSHEIYLAEANSPRRLVFNKRV